MKPVAIVTGGARNIGLAIVQRLMADYQVVIADLVEPLAPLAGDVHFLNTNICMPSQVEALMEKANALGPVQALVHSAAITAPAVPVEDLPLEEWERIVNVNLTGSFVVCKAAIATLRRNQGAMVLLTSRAGKSGMVLNQRGKGVKAHYCASKAGVISLTKSLAFELAPDVRVNGVAPGPIEGEMIPREAWERVARHVPLGRLGTTREIADAVHFLLSPAAGFITGHILDVNGGTLMD
ncbi:MAG: SDR family NAD(P)-dependent oxidoreductase [Castellaniella sp.]